VFEHVADRRPESLQGYQEIVSEDTATEIPVTMEPGDVLFFHSYLMHRSTDNVADYRRSAMVYHYAEAGTEPVDAIAAATLAHVNRWLPARRATSNIPA
jgi:ectoine hydroxylase-related dioxygenase (phytanoyl-CoA dioxygenase family)